MAPENCNTGFFLEQQPSGPALPQPVSSVQIEFRRKPLPRSLFAIVIRKNSCPNIMANKVNAVFRRIPILLYD